MLLGIILISLLVVTIFFSWSHYDSLSTSAFHKAVFWTCLLVNILLLISVLALVVSAAENSAPAESAITVKGYACPTEFNPDDLGWAMHEIAEPELKNFGEDIVVVEHRRVFSYFPDPEQRIFVGIKKWGNPDCVAELFSYGPVRSTNQKRVWAAIRSSNGTAKTTTVFLLTDKGWEKGGGNMPETFVMCGTEQCNLFFALYRNGIQVASRALSVEPVKRFFNF